MSHEGHDHVSSAGSAGRRRLTVVLVITCCVLVVEVVGALLSGSLALLVDAAHMLTDVAALGLALAAAILAGRPPTDSRTWGLRRLEVVAAAAQAAALLVVGGFVLIEAIRRLADPTSVDWPVMLTFGIVGFLGNGVGIAVLAGSRADTLNLRAAFLEVLNDALGSAAVVVAAIVIATAGWTRADPVTSLLIGALIVPRTIKLLRDSVNVLLESTPAGMELSEVRAHLLRLSHVIEIHDLHATQVATGLPVLTVHAVVSDACFHDGHLMQLLDQVQDCLAGHFDVAHSTIQFEPVSHAEHERAAHP